MAGTQGPGPGKSAATMLPATAITSFSHPTGRQRDEGGLPSGKSNATNASSEFIGTQSQQVIQAAARERLALHHQRVDGVLAAKQVHSAEETHRAEEPPYGARNTRPAR